MSTPTPDAAGKERELEFWTPTAQNSTHERTLEEIVQAYLTYLQVCAPEQHKLFLDRRKNNPDGASAEAAVFSWLRAEKLCPSINEKPGLTGADFLCTSIGGSPFLVEVTCLNSIAVTNQSHWLEKDRLDGVARHFKMITPQLVTKAEDKTRQLSTAPTNVPGVLAICLVHPMSSLLLGTLAARWLMASEPTIKVPITATGERIGPVKTVSDLKFSVFLESPDGAVIPARKSISAILLISLWKHQSEIVGMLHPEPIAALNYRVFPKVPFLRLNWPLTNPIEMEWVIGDPSSHVAYYQLVRLTDDELKGK